MTKSDLDDALAAEGTTIDEVTTAIATLLGKLVATQAPAPTDSATPPDTSTPAAS